MGDEYRIDDLVDREVYVKERLVGTIVGERFHPKSEFVRSMRIEVAPDVAEEYMRKPAGIAPLGKDLVHSIGDDGSVKLSKSMRELQRRWRNTVRINERLFAPDELIDRAVMDNDGYEIGTVIDLVRVKRTYRGVVIRVLPAIRRRMSLPEKMVIPVNQLGRTTARLDEIILSRSINRVMSLPTCQRLNSGEYYDIA